MFLHKVKALTHISQRMHEVIPPLCLQKPIHRRKWKMGANQRWNFCRNLTHFPLFFTLTKSTPPFWNSCPLSWKLNTMQKWNYIHGKTWNGKKYTFESVIIFQLQMGKCLPFEPPCQCLNFNVYCLPSVNAKR